MPGISVPVSCCRQCSGTAQQRGVPPRNLHSSTCVQVRVHRACATENINRFMAGVHRGQPAARRRQRRCSGGGRREDHARARAQRHSLVGLPQRAPAEGAAVHAPARARQRLRRPAQLAWLRALRLQGADVGRGSARARWPALALQAQGVAVIQVIRPEADNSSGDWSVAGRVCAQCCARTPRCCLDSATRGAAQANAPTWLPHTRLLRGLEVQVLAKVVRRFALSDGFRSTGPESPYSTSQPSAVPLAGEGSRESLGTDTPLTVRFMRAGCRL